MLHLRMMVVVAASLAACSKTSTEKTESAAPAGSNAGSSAPANAGSSAGSAAAVDKNARTVKGTLEFSGSLTGTFHWNTKGELSCGWHADKKVGGFHFDLTDGADHETGGTAMAMGADEPENVGRDIKLTIDAHPPGRLDLISLDLEAPMKTSKGFEVTGPDNEHITLKIDTTLTEVIVDPDKPKEKQAKKAAGPSVTIKGTLEIYCPPKAK